MASCIVTFDTVSVGLPALLAARLRGIPLVARVPGDYAWEQGTQRYGVGDSMADFQIKKYGVRVELLRFVQRTVVQGARLVIAPSDYFAAVVRGWGVSHSALRRIYLGLPSTASVIMPSDAPDGRILFSMGRFVPWKGFPLLLKLLVALPSWHLVLAGDGPERKRLERMADEYGVQDRVTFLGTTGNAEVLGWLRRADAFVYNTQWESFSFQVLEALASGIPVITTRVGSLPELVEDGVEGVLCEPDDLQAFIQAVESITTERAQWENRRTAAMRKSQQFTIHASATQFVKELKNICT
jgi:glycosyltransferase involved in cell wall biosynthesis